MASYKCTVCGYIYDEEKEGKKWEELPDDWVCPVCGAAKSSFERSEEDIPGTENNSIAQQGTGEKKIICSVCGYIINEGYPGDVCPACGVSKTAFQVYVDRVSQKRRKILNLHIHNILVHFPQAFSLLMLFLIFTPFFLKGPLQSEFLITFKVISIFLPFSVAVSIISGVLDGKHRFKRINTPILKKKIIVAIFFLVFSIGILWISNVSGLQQSRRLILLVLTGCCALFSLFLGFNGGRLSGKEVPGQ